MAKKQVRKKIYKGNYVEKKRPPTAAKTTDPVIPAASKGNKGKKKAKAAPKKEFLSADQKKLYQKYMNEFSSFSMDRLKELLSKNRQVKSGNKSDLVARCAEGKLLGGLPNCPKCTGGKLKFNITTGEYYCKGYMDDDVFKNCGYKSDTATRLEWTE